MSNSKNILFIMTGSIAAYKACGAISSLKQKGYNLKVVMSPAALQFVGTATIEGLTGTPPITDMYAAGSVMDHIHLVRWADLIAVIPATANYINKVAHGLGDDLLTTLFLAHDFQKPFVLAPAMNTKMYLHPTVQSSLSKLREMGVEVLEAESGVLACGEVGYGRLLEPVLLVEEIEKRLKVETQTKKDLPLQSVKRLKVLITSGGTSEPIDDVRVITNKSTGKTAAFLAQQFSELGLEVTYVHAQNARRPLAECESHSFYTYQDLKEKLFHLLKANAYDVVIHAAAVSDYSVEKHAGKIPSSAETLELKLVRNQKLINEIKKLNPKAQLVGFKLTSTANVAEVKEKVQKLFSEAHCDFVVQNDWSQIEKGQHEFHVYSPELKSDDAGSVENLSLVLFQKILNERSL